MLICQISLLPVLSLWSPFLSTLLNANEPANLKLIFSFTILVISPLLVSLDTLFVIHTLYSCFSKRGRHWVTSSTCHQPAPPNSYTYTLTSLLLKLYPISVREMYSEVVDINTYVWMDPFHIYHQLSGSVPAIRWRKSFCLTLSSHCFTEPASINHCWVDTWILKYSLSLSFSQQDLFTNKRGFVIYFFFHSKSI